MTEVTKHNLTGDRMPATLDNIRASQQMKRVPMNYQEAIAAQEERDGLEVRYMALGEDANAEELNVISRRIGVLNNALWNYIDPSRNPANSTTI